MRLKISVISIKYPLVISRSHTPCLHVLYMHYKANCLCCYSSTGFTSHEVEELKHENYQLQFKLKQYSQMSELAKMLQESHK